MDTTFTDLVDYFRSIAEKHVDIQHSNREKHFFRFELDEVLSGAFSTLKYPALILEAYDLSYQENGADSIQKKRSGSFIIIDKVSDKKDYDKIHAAWDKCESIGDDILVKIRSDKQSRLYPLLRGFSISESSGIPLSVDTLNQYGIRFNFSIITTVSNIVNSEKWL